MKQKTKTELNKIIDELISRNLTPYEIGEYCLKAGKQEAKKEELEFLENIGLICISSKIEAEMKLKKKLKKK